MALIAMAFFGILVFAADKPTKLMSEGTYTVDQINKRTVRQVVLYSYTLAISKTSLAMQCSQQLKMYPR